MKHYVVKKESGSRYARVTHAPTGEVVKSFDILRNDGWDMADKYCERLNNERDEVLRRLNAK